MNLTAPLGLVNPLDAQRCGWPDLAGQADIFAGFDRLERSRLCTAGRGEIFQPLGDFDAAGGAAPLAPAQRGMGDAVELGDFQEG